MDNFSLSLCIIIGIVSGSTQLVLGALFILTKYYLEKLFDRKENRRSAEREKYEKRLLHMKHLLETCEIYKRMGMVKEMAEILDHLDKMEKEDEDTI